MDSDQTPRLAYALYLNRTDANGNVLPQGPPGASSNAFPWALRYILDSSWTTRRADLLCMGSTEQPCPRQLWNWAPAGLPAPIGLGIPTHYADEFLNFRVGFHAFKVNASAQVGNELVIRGLDRSPPGAGIALWDYEFHYTSSYPVPVLMKTLGWAPGEAQFGSLRLVEYTAGEPLESIEPWPWRNSSAPSWTTWLPPGRESAYVPEFSISEALETIMANQGEANDVLESGGCVQGVTFSQRRLTATLGSQILNRRDTVNRYQFLITESAGTGSEWFAQRTIDDNGFTTTTSGEETSNIQFYGDRLPCGALTRTPGTTLPADAAMTKINAWNQTIGFAYISRVTFSGQSSGFLLIHPEAHGQMRYVGSFVDTTEANSNLRRPWNLVISASTGALLSAQVPPGLAHQLNENGFHG